MRLWSLGDQVSQDLLFLIHEVEPLTSTFLGGPPCRSFKRFVVEGGSAVLAV